MKERVTAGERGDSTEEHDDDTIIIITVDGEEDGGGGVTDLVAGVTDVLTSVQCTDRGQCQPTSKVDDGGARRQRGAVTS